MGNFNKTTNMAFHAGIARRRAAATANHTWAVYSVKKNGDLYARPSSTHADEEAANREAARMQALNPNSRFAVKAV